jgi:hypothetical protein
VTRSLSAATKKSKRKREEPKDVVGSNTKTPKDKQVKTSPREKREIVPVAKVATDTDAQPPVSPPGIFEIEDEATDTEIY